VNPKSWPRCSFRQGFPAHACFQVQISASMTMLRKTHLLGRKLDSKSMPSCSPSPEAVLAADGCVPRKPWTFMREQQQCEQSIQQEIWIVAYMSTTCLRGGSRQSITLVTFCKDVRVLAAWNVTNATARSKVVQRGSRVGVNRSRFRC
jgi:hypothetical protein